MFQLGKAGGLRYAGFMSYDYEALYRTTPNALGAPTKAVVDFFRNHAGKSLRVLDVGCGQGRDALFIGRAGHSVLGIDLSQSGIRDLKRAAAKETLDVHGIVADVADCLIEGTFDVILVGRTLHILDEVARTNVLRDLFDRVEEGGWCLIADEPRHIPGFKRFAAAHDADWSVEREQRGSLFLRRGT